MPVTEQIIRRDAERELFRLLHSIGSCNDVKVRSGKLKGHINDGTRRGQNFQQETSKIKCAMAHDKCNK